MADPFAAQGEAPAPAPTAPAPAISPEIEAYIAQRVQALSDQRISGLQSVFDKKLAEANKEIQRVRRQALGEPDAPDFEDSETARENAELKRRLAIMEAAERFPKAAPLYQQLMGLETAEEQIAFLEQQLQQAPPPPPPVPPVPQPEPELEVPDIDMNRPAPTGGSGYAIYDGVQMNDEIAAAILKNINSWPTR